MPQSTEQTAPAPFSLALPETQTMPFVFSSPHSGRFYPEHFIAQSALDELTLRASEDAFVDELFGAAAQLGAPLIACNYPRAYVDVNREAWELDPDMFRGKLPPHVNTRSPRVAAGLGTIARVVAAGQNIYEGKLTFSDAKQRINNIYKPYHAELERLLQATHEKFGFAVLVDCHSMPTITDSFGDAPLRLRGKLADFVLGDRYGRACAPSLTRCAEEVLIRAGYRVRRNEPYPGGFNTRVHGQPHQGWHALQIEISRALYLDEPSVAKTKGFDRLQSHLTELIGAFAALDPEVFRPLARAAE